MPATPITMQILRAPLPPGKRKERHFDTIVRGMFAERRANGTTMYIRYRDQRGRQREYRIGSLGTITLEQARRKAKELMAQASLGADPAAERAALRAVLTIADFVDEHYQPDCERRLLSHKNQNAYGSRIKRRLGRKALDEVTWADVSGFKETLVREGLAAGTVNRHLAALRAMYNCAKRWGMFKGENPAAAPGMLPEQHRERFLTIEQDKALILALGQDLNQGAATAIAVLMVTGARKSEVTRAEWRHVDFERQELLVPRSKNGRPRRVPLPPVAIGLLRMQRRRCAANERYVFPGNVPERPIEDLRRVWTRTKKASGLPSDLRIHDLRHSMASRLANVGTPLYEIGAILGHQTLSTTQRYAHFAPQRLIETAALASGAWAALPTDK